MKTYSTLVAAFCLATIANAQLAGGPEHIEALHVRPSKEAPPLRSGSVNEWFIYEFEPQLVPVVDDFSIDRTRHLDAGSSDAGVTLTETLYELEVGGSSTADMSFVFDTTYHVTVEFLPDDTVVTTVPQPSIMITVYDLSAFPPPGHDGGGGLAAVQSAGYRR